VLCLDLVSSCLNGLYRLRLVESVPYLGDMLLFAPSESAGATYYRERLLEAQRVRPADVIVLGNEWFWNNGMNFDKVNTWPVFAAQLREDYVAVAERHQVDAPDGQAYRLYLRKGSDVLAEEEKAPLSR